MQIYSDKEASQSMVIKTCLYQGEKIYFRIKSCDPICSQIINYIAKTNNVPAEKCLIQFRGQPILPDHSVLDIRYVTHRNPRFGSELTVFCIDHIRYFFQTFRESKHYISF